MRKTFDHRNRLKIPEGSGLEGSCQETNNGCDTYILHLMFLLLLWYIFWKSDSINPIYKMKKNINNYVILKEALYRSQDCSYIKYLIL